MAPNFFGLWWPTKKFTCWGPMLAFPSKCEFSIRLFKWFHFYNPPRLKVLSLKLRVWILLSQLHSCSLFPTLKHSIKSATLHLSNGQQVDPFFPFPFFFMKSFALWPEFALVYFLHIQDTCCKDATSVVLDWCSWNLYILHTFI